MSSTSSPAHPSMSTSSPTTTAALQGTTTTASSITSSLNNASFPLEDFSFPTDIYSVQDRKDEALAALKSDLLASLDKEVKSLDEDSWMFDGPRSRINLIRRPGSFLGTKKMNQFPEEQRTATPSK